MLGAVRSGLVDRLPVHGGMIVDMVTLGNTCWDYRVADRVVGTLSRRSARNQVLVRYKQNSR